jgi:hypothetical protein
MAAPRDRRGVAIYVFPAGNCFDFDLADEMAKLSSHINKSYNLGHVEAHQIPWGELERFLDPRIAVVIYGDSPAAHPAVEA